MDNLRGALLMVLAMAGFALEDTFIKLTATALPVGQVLAILGIAGGTVFAILSMLNGKTVLSRDFFHPSVLMRNIFEMIGTSGYVLAFTLADLTTTTAITQSMPLVMALGAALFLGQEVGWRRWSAITVGFIGVLIIIRPSSDGVAFTAILAIIGTIGLSARDLVTRNMPSRIDSLPVSSWAFYFMVPLGIGMMLVMGDAPVSPKMGSVWQMTAAVFFGVMGYYMLVRGTRIGDIAVVSPFRYSRILFALVLGYTVFGERPDMLTYVGAIIIVVSGLYTLYRESRRRASITGNVPL